jgi:flagella basal body P-ring formation protein FlgA
MNAMEITPVKGAMLAMLALCWATPAAAQEGAPPRQALDAVKLAAEDFLRGEAQGLPGKVTLEVDRPDDRVSLAACAQMTAFFPAGSRAWGRTTVGVRCTAPTPWTLYMAARVRIRAQYFETARALSAGQQVAETDLVRRHGDIDELPPGVVTEPSQAVGRKLANSLRAGTPLRADVLREPPAIQQGELVGLVIAGPGFRVSSEGHSLGKAAEGKVVQVRTPSGAVVSGVVRPGPVVEILR